MSNHFLENLVINVQKIPSTNSGTKFSEFSIFINLFKTNQIAYDEKTIKNTKKDLDIESYFWNLLLDTFCWNYNFIRNLLTLKVKYSYNPRSCGFSYLQLWSIYLTVLFKISFLSNATFRCNIHATFCFLIFHSDLA